MSFDRRTSKVTFPFAGPTAFVLGNEVIFFFGTQRFWLEVTRVLCVCACERERERERERETERERECVCEYEYGSYRAQASRISNGPSATNLSTSLRCLLL